MPASRSVQLGAATSDLRSTLELQPSYSKLVDGAINSIHGEPMVSIIIPCYNAGPFLAAAVESALASNFSSFEVIIVDDGSTDPQTLGVLNDLRDRRVRIYRQENSGVAAARNRAIHESRGRYIAPLDADDLLSADFIPEAVAILELDANLGIVFGAADYLGDQSGPFVRGGFDESRMVLANQIPVFGIYRRCDWDRLGGYALDMLEDYDLWLGILELGRTVHYIDRVVYRYRRHQDSATSRVSESTLVEAEASVVRRHPEFFMKYAHVWVRDHREVRANLARWKQRYGWLERLRSRTGSLSRRLRGKPR